MQTVFSDNHRLHVGPTEIYRGKLEEWFEKPSRADTILARVQAQALGTISSPADFGLDVIHRVHDVGYVSFLQNAWNRWIEGGGSDFLIPSCFPSHRVFRNASSPQALIGELGSYCYDTEAPIGEGTWKAVYSSAQVALTAQDKIRDGAHTAFGLCRPPGHHSGRSFMGGYCYLNNAAIAAQAFLDQGSKRVAILDVDYHHGNGTQDIFYKRSDVLFASIHATPIYEYPYFAGHADERGALDGEGFNLNYPLALGSAWAEWSVALESACRQIAQYSPDALVVSLGVDTFKDDPISQFKIESPDFLRIGEKIAKLNVPTLFIMEGGYAVEEIGINAVNVLQGYQSAARK